MKEKRKIKMQKCIILVLLIVFLVSACAFIGNFSVYVSTIEPARYSFTMYNATGEILASEQTCTNFKLTGNTVQFNNAEGVCRKLTIPQTGYVDSKKIPDTSDNTKREGVITLFVLILVVDIIILANLSFMWRDTFCEMISKNEKDAS